MHILLIYSLYIAYPTDNANTNLFRKFVKITYTLTRPRYAFVIPKCRLHINIYDNICINAVHFASIKLWNKLNTKMKLIKNIKLFIKKLKISYIDNY